MYMLTETAQNIVLTRYKKEKGHTAASTAHKLKIQSTFVLFWRDDDNSLQRFNDVRCVACTAWANVLFTFYNNNFNSISCCKCIYAY